MSPHRTLQLSQAVPVQQRIQFVGCRYLYSKTDSGALVALTIDDTGKQSTAIAEQPLLDAHSAPEIDLRV